MKRRWISLVMVLVLLGSLMWIPCQASENNDVDKEPLNTENVMPADESGSEGGSGGSTEGGNGGSAEGGSGGGTTEGGNSGGTTEGGNSGGTTEGGNSGGTTEGGNSGGTTEGGNSGGTTEGGNSGGTTEGGNSGGTTEGGNSGGATEGGNSGGTTEGGNSGGTTEGGNSGGTTEGGNSGGTTEGGNSGGTTEGGNSGGTTEGGNSGGTTEGGNSGGTTEGGNSGGTTEGGNSGGTTEGGNSGGTTEGGSGTDKDNSSDTPPTQETTPKNPTYTDEEEEKTFGFCKHEYGEWEAQKWAHVRRCKKCWVFQSKAHVYNDSYAMDDEKNGHWLVCDDCGYQKSFSDHVMGEKYQNDGTGHWLACTLCDMKEEAEAHIPGPGANETRDQLCTVCEYIMVAKGTITENAPIPTEETVPVEETEAVVVTWEYNDLTHWQDDGSGEKHNQSVHKWDSGAKQPDDSTVYVCTVCSAMMVDDGSDEQNAFIKGAMAAGFVVVMVILTGALFMFLIKSKNPGRYSGRRSRR